MELIGLLWSNSVSDDSTRPRFWIVARALDGLWHFQGYVR